jgi:PAS domain-containing protein
VECSSEKSRKEMRRFVVGFCIDSSLPVRGESVSVCTRCMPFKLLIFFFFFFFFFFFSSFCFVLFRSKYRVGNQDEEEEEEVFPVMARPQPAEVVTAIQMHPEQQRVNQYILAEIAKIKQDNKRLNDEVLALRMENMTLNSRINMLPAIPGLQPLEYSQSNIQVMSKPQQELPFVEFDMRKQPPTVQSANVMFCSLLGYKTEEVLGKPWQYFIQDDFIERTVRTLQRDGGAKQMQFSQVYKVGLLFVVVVVVSEAVEGSQWATHSRSRFAHIQPRRKRPCHHGLRRCAS